MQYERGIKMNYDLYTEHITGREILDSRGNPTVEAQVVLCDGSIGVAAAPSGASTGSYEAIELRDGDKTRYSGKGVKKAVSYINDEIYETLKGCNPFNQLLADRLMIKADGTQNKGHFGANAILSVSLAVAKAAANALEMPLYRYIGGVGARTLPVPMMNIINGGAHARNLLDFQEFMIMPVSAGCFREALRMGTEVYHSLKRVLEDRGLSTAVGDEGGFAPDISNAHEALSLLMEAVSKAGYEAGRDIVFAMDAAASELYRAEYKAYCFEGEGRAKLAEASAAGSSTQQCGIVRNADEMIEYYENLINSFPLVSIEDGLDENDWEGWRKLTDRLGSRVQLVGDDLFVTNTERLKKGIEAGCANSVLIKPNQIGTLTETIEAVRMAHSAGYTAILSHRSGETEDATIADIAVALGTGQIKTGAPCRSERVAKYNRLLKIEEELAEISEYKGMSALKAIKNS